jgi:hypothetical protein
MHNFGEGLKLYDPSYVIEFANASLVKKLHNAIPFHHIVYEITNTFNARLKKNFHRSKLERKG